MTKKNRLIAVVSAALLSVSMLTGATESQTQAKSEPTKAAQSVVSSTTVASKVVSHASPHRRATPKAVVKIKPKAVKPKHHLALPVVGVHASAWRGAGYYPQWENVRKCIVQRESHGNYRINNRSGSTAAGAYQMLIKTSNGVARNMHRPDLVGKRASSWSRIDQDHGFWILWRNGKGKHHWYWAGHRQCW